ncbi:hypothetical protein Anapl_10152 [Anas platyrhynchos]|uniref:Uncharacterized protein n=1 Tax=Anas platyrhynchos TaxID=8839 RepID=R0LRA3_ANAPL|nr:hypothetical protein Anapl_10152 [Anas platyrhynchos]
MHISLAPVTLHQPYACSSKNLSIQGLGFCFLIKSWSSVFQGEAKTLSATACHGHPVTAGSLRAHQAGGQAQRPPQQVTDSNGTARTEEAHLPTKLSSRLGLQVHTAVFWAGFLLVPQQAVAGQPPLIQQHRAHHITQRVHGHVGHSHTLNNGFLVDKLGLETSIWDLHAHTLCVCRRKMGEKESEAAEEEGGARDCLLSVTIVYLQATSSVSKAVLETSLAVIKSALSAKPFGIPSVHEEWLCQAKFLNRSAEKLAITNKIANIVKGSQPFRAKFCISAASSFRKGSESPQSNYAGIHQRSHLAGSSKHTAMPCCSGADGLGLGEMRGSPDGSELQTQHPRIHGHGDLQPLSPRAAGTRILHLSSYPLFIS